LFVCLVLIPFVISSANAAKTNSFEHSEKVLRYNYFARGMVEFKWQSLQKSTSLLVHIGNEVPGVNLLE
jgi:hypothetical protein